LILVIIFSAASLSGQRTGVSSILEKSNSWYGLSSAISPTEEVNAFISKLMCFKYCLANAPATTQFAVSLAELLPPPL